MTSELDGLLLADHDWLAERVSDTGRRWRCDDARVNGTLWWYSASVTLLAVDADPALEHLRITLRPNGYLEGARSTRPLRGPSAPALAAMCARIIEPLAGASGAGARALWAIASDSLGRHAVASGRWPTAVKTVPPMLPLRFVDVDAGGARPACGQEPLEGDARRFVRRSSCCLIYEVPNEGKCRACPRQKPDERTARLRAAR